MKIPANAIQTLSAKDGHDSLRPSDQRVNHSFNPTECANNSNVPSEVSHATFEDFCNFGKRFKCNLLFRPLDVANVIARQIGFFRQLLLTQMSFLPSGADGFPQKAINFARGWLHDFP